MGSRIIPSPLGGALGTSRDRILHLAVAVCPAPPTSRPTPPSAPPQASLGANIRAGPSVSLCPHPPVSPSPPPPPACTGKLSQTEEEAWLPGRVGLPGTAQPQCDPTSPGNSPNLGPQRTSGNSEGWQQGLSGGLRACGMPLRSSCWRRLWYAQC